MVKRIRTMDDAVIMAQEKRHFYNTAELVKLKDIAPGIFRNLPENSSLTNVVSHADYVEGIWVLPDGEVVSRRETRLRINRRLGK